MASRTRRPVVRCSFLPPYLLERVAAMHPDDAVGGCCRGTLAIDAELRERRHLVALSGRPATAAPMVPVDGAFAVFSAGNGTTLPGQQVRGAAEDETGDAAVDEAWAGVKESLALFAEEYSRSSYDDRGAPVVATVHYGRSYNNAFWDGQQLVFGDGDGKVFTRFTKPIDVLGHEFTHAVTEHTAGLVYQGQPGALNESVSDVFAACLKQRLLGQTSQAAEWLIGEGLFLPSVQGDALRSMKEPGTAYDDPVLGKDPQVGSMADYVETNQDNGGVHINSGIPNRAFHLAAVALGGNAWEAAGQVWYAALTSGLRPDTDFATFADATVTAAAQVSDEARAAVAGAWTEVGVPVGALVPGGAGSGTSPSSPPADGGGLVVVTRSGGIVGRTEQAEAHLGDDPRSADLERLLSRIDLQQLAGAPGSPAQPDRYVYTFAVDGREVMLGEQDLTPELAELATLLLDR
ncbi:protealysin inhibitor emfourin [Nocardioides iriomotensis]|uniref:Neutral metalloproteinase n=1 Tax=Nocardioides iriomotensis TaxID=715784 RepID=A0A4Q5J6Y5_9ACTN|nr:protealysin inhibitor emfourin [Nocardioides iriomotensis]RYU13365.1 M4 family peptidase [Nocardioides iriomotensis]